MTLDQLLEICGKATPPPWAAEHNKIASHVFAKGSGWFIDAVTPYGDWLKARPQSHCDIDYVATFNPAVVAALINVAKAAETLTIGAALLSVLEDHDFKRDTLAVLNLREALAALTKEMEG